MTHTVGKLTKFSFHRHVTRFRRSKTEITVVQNIFAIFFQLNLEKKKFNHPRGCSKKKNQNDAFITHSASFYRTKFHFTYLTREFCQLSNGVHYNFLQLLL